MLFRYVQIDKDWNRDEEKYIQGETVEDYAERVKAIKSIGEVMCGDGIVGHVLGIEYSPESSNTCASIDVYLES